MEAYEPIVAAHTIKTKEPTGTAENFQPKGAIAFFVCLVLLGLIIWFGIYFLMLSRI